MTIDDVDKLKVGDIVYFICDGSEYEVVDTYSFKFLKNNVEQITIDEEFARDMRERMLYLEFEEKIQ